MICYNTDSILRSILTKRQVDLLSMQILRGKGSPTGEFLEYYYFHENCGTTKNLSNCFRIHRFKRFRGFSGQILAYKSKAAKIAESGNSDLIEERPMS
jgi:hypothetical protein